MVGKTSKQIMMKNPLMMGIKKYIMKDNSIKRIVADYKLLDQIIEKIGCLAELAAPSKRRLRAHMQMIKV